MLPYLLNTFTNVFCRTVLGDKASKLKQVPRFLKVDHRHTRQEEDQSMKKSCLVSWAFFSLFFEVCAWVYGNGCVSGCLGSRQERVIMEIVRKAIVAGQLFCISWTHLQIYKYFLSVLSQARKPRTWTSPEEHLPSFLAVDYHHTGQEEDN